MKNVTPDLKNYFPSHEIWASMLNCEVSPVSYLLHDKQDDEMAAMLEVASVARLAVLHTAREVGESSDDGLLLEGLRVKLPEVLLDSLELSYEIAKFFSEEIVDNIVNDKECIWFLFQVAKSNTVISPNPRNTSDKDEVFRDNTEQSRSRVVDIVGSGAFYN